MADARENRIYNNMMSPRWIPPLLKSPSEHLRVYRCSINLQNAFHRLARRAVSRNLPPNRYRPPWTATNGGNEGSSDWDDAYGYNVYVPIPFEKFYAVPTLMPI